MPETATAVVEGTAPQPTPELPAASSSASSTPAQTNVTSQEGRDTPTARDDSYERRVLERLDDGLSVEQARKAASEPDPAAAEAGTKADAAGKHDTAGTGKPADQTASAPAVSSSTRNDASHDGLDDVSRQALSQAHLLPDAAVWNMMSKTQQQNALNAARELLASRTREYQRNNGNKGPARDAQGRFAQQHSPEQGEPNGSPQDDPAAQPSRADRQPPAQEVTPPRDDRTDVEQSRAQRPNLPKRLQEFADTLGEDLAKPLLEGLTELVGANRQENEQLRQQLHQMEERNRQAAVAQLAQEERTTRTSLANDLPSLASDEAQWNRVKANAAILAQAQSQETGTWNWGDCLRSAAKFLFHSDIQQEAQRNLASKRRDALRGTPERGTELAKPESVADKDEWDRLAFEKLEQGQTVEEVRKSRLVGV